MAREENIEKQKFDAMVQAIRRQNSSLSERTIEQIRKSRQTESKDTQELTEQVRSVRTDYTSHSRALRDLINLGSRKISGNPSQQTRQDFHLNQRVLQQMVLDNIIQRKHQKHLAQIELNTLDASLGTWNAFKLFLKQRFTRFTAQRRRYKERRKDQAVQSAMQKIALHTFTEQMRTADGIRTLVLAQM